MRIDRMVAVVVLSLCCIMGTATVPLAADSPAPAPASKAAKPAKTGKAQTAPQKKAAQQSKQGVQARQDKQGKSGVPLTFPAVATHNKDLSLWMPDRVEQGGVAVVRLDIAGDVQNVTFVWLGTKIDVNAQPIPDRPHVSRALVLVPVPVDAAVGKPLVLEARAGKQSVRAQVRVLPVAWPRQEISVDNKYVTPPKEVTERIMAEQARVKQVLQNVTLVGEWAVPFERPVPGEPSSVFGGKRIFNGQPRSMHRGVDLRGASGTPVKALAQGQVVLAENQYFSGNVVYVDHGQGFITLYAHLSAFKVREGDRVEAGQVLGLVGATGRVTGPHLHLGAQIRGQAVNPLALLALPDLRY